MVRVQLIERDGTLGYQADREIRLAPKSELDFEHDFEATGIRFWNGLKDPYLYTARIEVFRGRRMQDMAEAKIGYRSRVSCLMGSLILFVACPCIRTLTAGLQRLGMRISGGITRLSRN